MQTFNYLYIFVGKVYLFLAGNYTASKAYNNFGSSLLGKIARFLLATCIVHGEEPKMSLLSRASSHPLEKSIAQLLFQIILKNFFLKMSAHGATSAHGHGYYTCILNNEQYE